jgi:hypothetical protein
MRLHSLILSLSQDDAKKQGLGEFNLASPIDPLPQLCPPFLPGSAFLRQLRAWFVTVGGLPRLSAVRLAHVP